MKKLFFISILFVFAVGLQAQLAPWQSKTIYSDSTKTVSATAVYLTITPAKTLIGETMSISGLCTNISGTSEGTIILQGSNDATGLDWVNIDATTYPNGGFTPNDTVTITDGQSYHFLIPVDFKYYREKIVGGASDATGVTNNVLFH